VKAVIEPPKKEADTKPAGPGLELKSDEGKR